ncbi:NAD(P)-dependent oxidoreductase, partial [Staphylococcus simulans]
MVLEVAMPIAKAQNKNLEDIKASNQLNWTFISPSSFYDPEGQRTGNYRVGMNGVLTKSEGESYVSYPDYALALGKEIQNADFNKQHITVVSEKA